MLLSRRDFLKAASALAAAFGLRTADLWAADDAPPTVIWLQGQSCSGCSMSLLNYIGSLGTIDKVLQGKLRLAYHPTLMAAAGAAAKAAADSARQAGGYILAVEGGIPQKDGGRYCELWPGTTMLDGVRQFAPQAKYILAVGTCGAFGGIAAAAPNPTGAAGVSAVLGNQFADRIYNIPGCAAHPDWIVGTVAALISGNPPAVDRYRRPRTYYGRKLHDCQYEDSRKCLKRSGCKGPLTYSDCKSRLWNAGAKDAAGVNWCLQAGSPCLGCTEPSFPDGMMPFARQVRRGG
jgi:hydrogenase small subunit